MDKIIDADILIIGGGAAGVWSAIRAHNNGLKPYLACKGLVGKSGATIFAGILGGYKPPGGFTAQSDWFNILCKHKTHWLGDQDYMKSLAEYTGRQFLEEIERIGVYIRRKEDGTLLTNLGKSLITVAPKWGLSSMVLMQYLKGEMVRRKIPFVEETYVTSLIEEDHRVVGATLLDIVTGEFYAVRAKAVFVATGISNALCKRSTATREQVGNGIAMAYRVGAPIQGLEQQWFHTNDIASPKCWQRLHLFPNQIPGSAEVGWMRNSEGEVFFTQNQFPYCIPPYFMQCRQLIKEIYNGKARKDGGYYQDYRHVEREVLDEHGYQLYPLKKLGIDVSKDLIEVGISWHMTFGGIRVNRKLESEVKGLYALGGVAGTYCAGVNAASHDAMVIEREGVFEDIRNTSLAQLNPGKLDSEKNRIWGYLKPERSGSLLPAQVKKHIREIMWDHMSYNKSEEGMVKALEKLEDVRQNLLPNVGLGTLSKRHNRDWVDAIDIEDMLICCEIAIQESRYRKESRGPHYREDFPFVDNEQWIVNVVARNEQGKMKIYSEPIELKYASPQPPMKEDFLSSLW